MRVLIIDEMGLFRDGLATQLQALACGSIVTEAAGLQEGIDVVSQSGPFDTLFVEIPQGLEDWKSVLNELFAASGSSRNVILSSRQDSEFIAEMFHLGIVGFIPKQSSREKIRAAVRLILEGVDYLPWELLKVQPSLLGAASRSEPRRRPARDQHLSAPPLTARQFEVLTLLSLGKSNKQIAYSLDLSEATVKLHVNGLLRAFHVSNRTAAASAARRAGLVKE